MTAPHSNRKSTNPKRCRGKTDILTDSLFKMELKDSMVLKNKYVKVKTKGMKRKTVSNGKGKAQQRIRVQNTEIV